MKPRMEESTTLWMNTESVPRQHTLQKNLDVDVCVIGAGIAGLTTAYLLLKEGYRVAVLESRHIAAGQTQRTTAHLTNAHDNLYSEVEKIHGEKGIRIAAASHTAAINRIEEIIRTEVIDCDFTRLPGYLFSAPETDPSIIDREFDAATRAGIEGLEIVKNAPIVAFETGRAICYPNQAQFHPLKYMRHLSQVILAQGGEIYTGNQVTNVKGGSPTEIECANGPTVTAKSTVVATNSPINDLFSIHMKQAPFSTYVIGTRVPHGTVRPALYWDTEQFYHYVRTHPVSSGEDMLLIGGEDHRAGQAEDEIDRHHRLEEWARVRFPMMAGVEYRWSGTVMETTDGGAFIGRSPGHGDNVYIATGDSGMGMTHGTMAGIILTDLIAGRHNDWSEFYDPARMPVAGMALRNFLADTINVGKEFIAGRVPSPGGLTADELQPDEGTVVRRGLSQVAVYRDKEGSLHECSPVCPHLGCIVHWNKLEKVWDCPCHGSRFDAYGELVNGPADCSLAPIAVRQTDSPQVAS